MTNVANIQPAFESKNKQPSSTSRCQQKAPAHEIFYCMHKPSAPLAKSSESHRRSWKHLQIYFDFVLYQHENDFSLAQESAKVVDDPLNEANGAKAEQSSPTKQEQCAVMTQPHDMGKIRSCDSPNCREVPDIAVNDIPELPHDPPPGRISTPDLSDIDESYYLGCCNNTK